MNDIETRPVTFDTVQFIYAVKSQPTIWNTKCKDYMNREARSKAWDLVAHRVFPDWSQLSYLEKSERGRELQKKWKNVKDSFMKELKLEQKCKKEPNTRRKKRYVFYEHLLFLLKEDNQNHEEGLDGEGGNEDENEEDAEEEAAESSSQQASNSEDTPWAPDSGSQQTSNSEERAWAASLDTVSFLKAIEDRPAIWDVRTVEYADKNVKNRAWMDVLHEFSDEHAELSSRVKKTRVRELQRRWKGIRDTYTKTLKPGEQNAIISRRKRRYMFDANMRFLIPVINRRVNDEEETIIEEDDFDPESSIGDPLLRSWVASLNIVRLLKEIECHKTIWDTRTPEYSDKTAKRHAWFEVVQELSDDWEEISARVKNARARESQKRWKSIRDTFTKTLKTGEQHTKTGRHKRRYVYDDYLRFLIPVIALRAKNDFPFISMGIKNLHCQVTRETLSQLKEEGYDGDGDDISDHCGRNSPASQAAVVASEADENEPLRKRTKLHHHQGAIIIKQEPSFFADTTLDHRPPMVTAPLSPATMSTVGVSGDYDQLFLLSLLPIFRGLSDLDKIQARIEMTQVLQRLARPHGFREFNQQQKAYHQRHHHQGYHHGDVVSPACYPTISHDDNSGTGMGRLAEDRESMSTKAYANNDLQSDVDSVSFDSHEDDSDFVE